MIDAPINNLNDLNAIIRSPLEFDRTDDGYMGRKLGADVLLSDGTQLRNNDRLHPSDVVFDVGDLERLRSTQPWEPIVIKFWRLNGQPKEARLLHHSPLMRIEGVGISSWALDLLRTWHLAPLLKVSAKILWFIIRSDCLAVNLPWLLAEDTMQLQMNALRAKYFIWVKQQQRNDPLYKQTAASAWNLTLSMLGPEYDPAMHLKANESLHFINFAVAIMEEYAVELMAHNRDMYRILFACAKSAQDVNRIIRESPRVMTLEQQQSLMNAYLRHMRLWIRCDGHIVPKHHYMIHLIIGIGKHGNPRFYWTYRDESLNGIVTKLAKSCHRMTFMSSTHDKFKWLDVLDLCSAMH